jgi:predicted acylesterase/phospholipase RssA
MAETPHSPKRALALAGGGFTGYLFEIGALIALDDLFDDGFTVSDFDLYVGVSAGAAAAALIANGVKPEEILEANLSGARPYYFERRDIFAPAMGESLKSVLRMVQQLIPLLKQYVRHYREMSLIDLLDKAQDALPSGMYTLKPFVYHLETTFAMKGLSNSFEGLRKELYIPAIDLETGQTVIFGDEEWRQVPISLAVTASSAAPVYFCPVRIEGRDYIDAGIGRVTFFDVAIQRGADFMVIINPAAHIQHDIDSCLLSEQPPRLPHKGFLSITEQASRINLEARVSQALRLFRQEHPDKEYFVVSPKPTETSLFDRSFLSFRDRVLLLRCGYLSVAEVVTEHLEPIRARFARHGLSISLAKLQERMKTRMEQFAGAGVAPSPAPAGHGQPGWSSAKSSFGA